MSAVLPRSLISTRKNDETIRIIGILRQHNPAF